MTTQEIRNELANRYGYEERARYVATTVSIGASTAARF